MNSEQVASRLLDGVSSSRRMATKSIPSGLTRDGVRDRAGRLADRVHKAGKSLSRENFSEDGVNGWATAHNLNSKSKRRA